MKYENIEQFYKEARKRSKDWYSANSEYKKEYQRKRYQEKREEILEKQRQKYHEKKQAQLQELNQ